MNNAQTKDPIRLRIRVAAILISCFLAIGAAEVMVRIVDPGGISYYDAVLQDARDKIPVDSDLVYRHRPSWRTRYQGVDVASNEFGFRDTPVYPRAPGEYRILVLGDSVVFGWGVPFDDIFTSRLQVVLSRDLARPVRVINTGITSYNTVQEYTYLKTEGLLLQPDLVILVYVPNDIGVHHRFDPSAVDSFKGKSLSQQMQLVLRHSKLYVLARHIYAVRFGIVSDDESDPHGRAASMAAMKAIVDACRGRGIPLLVFYYRMQVTPFETALLADVRAAARPAPVEDVAPWFTGKDIRKYMNSRVDSHPNRYGHQVMADRIAHAVVSTVQQRTLPTTSSLLEQQ